MKRYSYKILLIASLLISFSVLLLGILPYLNNLSASGNGLPFDLSSLISLSLQAILLIIIVLFLYFFRSTHWTTAGGKDYGKRTHGLPGIFHEMPAAMFIISVHDERIVDFNQSFLRLIDYPAMEVTGKTLRALGIFYPRSNKINIVDEIKYKSLDRGSELMIRTGQGHTIFVSITAQSILVDNTPCLLSVVSDITDRKRAEIHLRESEERYALMMKNLKEYALFMLDPQGFVANWNEGSEAMTGYASGDIVGKHFSIFYTLQQLEENRPERSLGFARLHGEHSTEEWQVRKDGANFYADVMITRIYDDRGRVKGFVYIIRDKTLRQKVEDELKNTLEKEKALNEMKSNFVTMASHEFRTPLSTIMSSAFLLENYTKPEDHKDREKHFERIRSSVKSLISILDEFLSVKRIDEKKTDLIIEPINLKEYILNFCYGVEGSARRGQKIYYRHEGREEIGTDSVSLHHILSNLISNAVKYSPENSRINIVSRVSGGKAIIAVKDQGMGISPEDQKHLFERFFRSPTVNGIQGTGLGLHIMKHYVDQLKGSIRIESEMEKGTEFIVEFDDVIGETVIGNQ